ncbi:hypothetical protein PENSPDRAFT_740546 [Peniophora sp. CONT]|nr:hypothetical protein PENSPDRAFT_740546 [Peniophora sp. CONT]
MANGATTAMAVAEHVRDQPPVHATQPFIFRLPPELFACVVKLCAQLEPPRPMTAGRRYERRLIEMRDPWSSPVWGPVIKGGSLGFFRLTHVCHTWRAMICEAMPLLWARYTGIFPVAFKAMFRRAGTSAPLDVHALHNHCHEYIEVQPWKMLEEPVSWYWWPEGDFQAYKNRIRSVLLVDVRSSVGDLEAYERAPYRLDDLHNLEELEVHYLEYHAEDLEEARLTHPDSCIIISPHLQRVRFTNYFIHWTSNRVTHLCLTLDGFRRASLPIKLFLDTLLHVGPTIEELELDYCIPNQLTRQKDVAFLFPRLSYLRIRDADDMVAELLRKVQHPPAIRLSVTIIATEEHWNITVQPALTGVLRRMALTPDFTNLVVTASHGETPLHNDPICNFTQFRLRTGAAPALTCCADNCPAQVTLGVESAFEDGFGGAKKLVALLDAYTSALWQNITFLDLDFFTCDLPHEAQDILDRLPHLRQLRLVDPIDVSHDGLIGDIFIPSLAQILSAPRVDLLWIQQHVNPDCCQAEALCQVLASELRKILEHGREVASADDLRPAITILRLDLVEVCDGVELPAEKGFIDRIFSGIAEQVVWRMV